MKRAECFLRHHLYSATMPTAFVDHNESSPVVTKPKQKKLRRHICNHNRHHPKQSINLHNHAKSPPKLGTTKDLSRRTNKTRINPSKLHKHEKNLHSNPTRHQIPRTIQKTPNSPKIALTPKNRLSTHTIKIYVRPIYRGLKFVPRI